MSASDQPFASDLAAMSVQLERLLCLRAAPIAMKLYDDIDATAAMKGVRRPDAIYTLDQVVAQAARLGWTVAVTAEDLVGPQCGAVVGLSPQNDEWSSGRELTGVWYATAEDAARHQAAMHTVPFGRYKALVVSPLSKARIETPDIVLFYATPGAMMYFINGLQWKDYRRLDWSVVGESSCADSWGRALHTREPSLSLPCFAERRYGGVLDDEMLMALTPSDLSKALSGMQALAENGLRYPVAQYGIQQDARAGMEVSRPKGR